MKIGDKVKVIREYSPYKGIVGIVFGKYKEDFRVIDEDMNIGQYSSFNEGDLELVEEATYIPVPKFHIGDIVYYEPSYYKGHILKGIIITERSDNMYYLVSDIGDDAWLNKSRGDANVIGIKEKDLSKDITEAEDKLSKDKPKDE